MNCFLISFLFGSSGKLHCLAFKKKINLVMLAPFKLLNNIYI